MREATYRKFPIIIPAVPTFQRPSAQPLHCENWPTLACPNVMMKIHEKHAQSSGGAGGATAPRPSRTVWHYFVDLCAFDITLQTCVHTHLNSKLVWWSKKMVAKLWQVPAWYMISNTFQLFTSKSKANKSECRAMTVKLFVSSTTDTMGAAIGCSECVTSEELIATPSGAGGAFALNQCPCVSKEREVNTDFYPNSCHFFHFVSVVDVFCYEVEMTPPMWWPGTCLNVKMTHVDTKPQVHGQSMVQNWEAQHHQSRRHDTCQCNWWLGQLKVCGLRMPKLIFNKELGGWCHATNSRGRVTGVKRNIYEGKSDRLRWSELELGFLKFDEGKQLLFIKTCLHFEVHTVTPPALVCRSRQETFSECFQTSSFFSCRSLQSPRLHQTETEAGIFLWQSET